MASAGGATGGAAAVFRANRTLDTGVLLMKRVSSSRSGLLACVVACLLAVAPFGTTAAWGDDIPSPGQAMQTPQPAPAQQPAQQQPPQSVTRLSGAGDQVLDAESNRNEVVIMADSLIGRPGGFASIGLGLGGFLVTLPFAILSGTVGETAEEFVVKPAEFTFTRPPGEFK